MGQACRLILFTRFPVPGQTKTRLIPALGPAGAAGLQRRLTLRALRAARTAAEKNNLELEIRFDAGEPVAMSHWLGDGPAYREQGKGNLGQRMARAVETSFQEGAAAVILIGSDCPELNAERLSQAFALLREHAVVLGPATDGGYYLLGLKQHLPGLFTGIAWGTHTVLASSLEVLRRTNLAPHLLPPLSDIDRTEDLPLWRRIVETEDKDLGSISVIIPALNEAENITSAISAASADPTHEIIVVDGGSTDDTPKLALQAGATVLRSPPGRARQMNCGSTQASGNSLVFVHADTFLPRAYEPCVAAQLGLLGVAAGAFRFKIRGHFRAKNLVERVTNWRSRWLQLPYGDQGLFLRRALFEELGGFAPLPIMEDYELVRRLRPYGRIVTVPLEASTAGRRWQRLGLVRTTLINQLMLMGFHLGWPPQKLAAMYRTSHLR